MAKEPSPLQQSARGVCSDTVSGFVWYCDEHDTHGNADSEQEARAIAAAHSDFQQDELGAEDPCEIFIYVRAEESSTPL